MSYAVFRYFLRGFILVRTDKPEVYTIPNRLWRILCAFTSKGELMDIGTKLKERASKLFDKERIEHKITNSLMSILS
jgi:hypothetical protein